jgi:hypothetical protein
VSASLSMFLPVSVDLCLSVCAICPWSSFICHDSVCGVQTLFPPHYRQGSRLLRVGRLAHTHWQSDVPIHCLPWCTVCLLSSSLSSISKYNMDIRIYLWGDF